MAKLDYEKMSHDILDNVGGIENISNINHCATRLRLKLKDSTKVNRQEIKKLNGVIGVEVAGEEIQIIVGQIIEDLFFAFEKVTGMKGGVIDENLDPEISGKKTPLSLFTSFLYLLI